MLGENIPRKTIVFAFVSKTQNRSLKLSSHPVSKAKIRTKYPQNIGPTSPCSVTYFVFPIHETEGCSEVYLAGVRLKKEKQIPSVPFIPCQTSWMYRKHPTKKNFCHYRPLALHPAVAMLTRLRSYRACISTPDT
jgi:hypothetical protein